ncbi:hypothetical protein GR248_24285 [Rhizobium leguminosarum]|uniref:peptidoglycan-binding domain-containing protein n=1 Tax=Rhizobium leguminosarum TaxID=384 RepID=UPI0013CADD4C|nr:peptidoglycan-binding protein [Rhizobium leguminosarum]NEI93921.1 hypothetical protein [Rhizobium leguminosarum]
MKFSVSDDILRDMFRISSFAVPENELVFVALRGCQPLEVGGSDFRNSHELVTSPVDYRHMRCTIGQWHTGTGKLAIFVGSSVPHITAVAAHLSDNGNGVNRLASGFFAKVPGMPDHRYFKGNHGSDRHLAFRNESKLPVWRTSDDTDYEGDDRFEFEVVYDNLHCSRQINEAASYYSSFGCVVVAGKEGDSGATKLTSELGPWKRFLENAYRIDQYHFALAVFEKNEAMRTAELGYTKRAPTVRFGSRGLLVERLQIGLVAKGYDIGSPNSDGLFGGHTAKALRQFQLDIFGKNGTDMIGGPSTAEALGLSWPNNGAEFDSLLQPVLPAGSSGQIESDPIASNNTNDEAAPPTILTPNPNLNIALDTGYKPLPGWQIRKQQGASRWDILFDGNASPVFLGRFFEYDGYSDATTRGLARTTSHEPRLAYNPADWTEFGTWPELIYPTAWAESNACFTVINAWDRAAMTFGFIQLAAHTGDDFLPFFRRLFVEIPDEAKKWFPELDVISGKLCFVKGNDYKSLENKVAPKDGGYTASYYHGDLMGFFNPDRYHTNLKPDPEELHAAARWVIWTMNSRVMRSIQVGGSIENVKSSLMKLHQKILATPAVRAKYPAGVDGMKCDLLSVAVAAPHLSESHLPMVLNALLKSDPIEAIRLSGYGPGGRAQNVHDGMLKRPVLKNLVYDMGAQMPA